ncbi:hypothetical protein EJB05_15514, partial [Eragrostis curvula]
MAGTECTQRPDEESLNYADQKKSRLAKKKRWERIDGNVTECLDPEGQNREGKERKRDSVSRVFKMADVAFGGVEKLVKVALAIKEAVETVKQNDKECRAIEKCAARCTAVLQKLEQKTDMMKDQVMLGPLEDVAESLEEALELVKLLDQPRAGDMAKELRRVKKDILQKVQLANFATSVQTTITLTDIPNARAAPLSLPPAPLPSDEVVPGFRKFSSYELRIAADNFSDKKVIGKGGTAIVYQHITRFKGIVPLNVQKLPTPLTEGAFKE